MKPLMTPELQNIEDGTNGGGEGGSAGGGDNGGAEGGGVHDDTVHTRRLLCWQPVLQQLASSTTVQRRHP